MQIVDTDWPFRPNPFANMTTTNPISLLTELFQCAVKNASAANCLPAYLDSLPQRPMHVFGAGKAAAAMAKVIEDHVEGPTTGLVITRYEHAIPVQSIEVVEAAHPVPDLPGVKAAEQMVNKARSLGPQDFVICAMSGGASSLLSLPHPKVAFEDKQAISRQLLLAGASIEELNCVRKHLSAIKGGRLMNAIYPAQALTLCISDVVGDDPSVIGSGPTVADPSTCADVLNVINRYRINVPDNIRFMLVKNELETPKSDAQVFDNSEVQIVARPQSALSASAKLATQNGLAVMLLGDRVAGDTNEVARQHAALVKKEMTCLPPDRPLVIISGGETTVNVRGSGKGGPNTQYALSLALALGDLAGVYALACDTDGIDGSEDNAGAFMTPTTLARAKKNNLDPKRYLDNNDAYSFFQKLGDLVVTGPTLTNVNDYRAILCLPAEC